MAKARPFSTKVPRRFRLVQKFSRNKKFDISGKRRAAFKRRKLRLLTRARLSAAKFIMFPFAKKKKR